jgi:hypothetical protein
VNKQNVRIRVKILAAGDHPPRETIKVITKLRVRRAPMRQDSVDLFSSVPRFGLMRERLPDSDKPLVVVLADGE